MSNKDSYIVTFQSSEISTLGEWLQFNSSPIFPTNGDNLTDADWQAYAEKFLTFTDTNNNTNRDHILIKLSDYDQKNVIVKKAIDWPLQVGTTFSIPYDQANRENVLIEGIQVASTNEPAFKAQKLADLENDKGYKKVIKTLSGGAFNNLQTIIPDITVWIWCRSLTDDGEKALSGKIFDLTPFIISCQSGSTKQGGNFQLSLAPIACEKDDKGKWVIKAATIKYNTQSSKIEYLSEGSIIIPNDNDSGSTRTRFLFHDMINPNDLIFIRYDTLEVEQTQRNIDSQSLFIDKKNLPDRIYDMIGLVDRNTQTISPQKNDVSINIAGRDLSKLIIEDGTYFYSFENKEGKPFMIGGSSQKSELGQRFGTEGTLAFLNLYFNKGIKEVLQFILGQLSSITIVPDDLFSFYGEQTTPSSTGITFKKETRNTGLSTSKQSKADDANFETQIDQKTDAVKSDITSQRTQQGILFKDSGAEKLAVERIYDDIASLLTAGIQAKQDEKTKEYISSLSTTGSTLSGWKDYQWASTIVKSNVVPDTLNTDLIANSTNAWLSTSVKNIFDQIYKIITLIAERAKNKTKEQLEDGILPGIWQIVKLVIDKSVSNRRIVDSSMTTASGSLLNFFRKVCQEPFVEFYMDTYGDEFYFIVRKPPFDKIGVQTLLNGGIITENGADKIDTAKAVITVKEQDMLQESLSFDDGQAYSWYHFTPTSSLTGNSINFATNYIPAVIFPKYAEIWGSRSLDVSHNYMPYLGLDNKPDNSSLSYFEQQAFEDMAYLVSSNQYLPFTRKGTITLNRDRRLKVGNLMRYEPTGEIFFIDSVQHNHGISMNSIDGTTTLVVSRGMVEKFVKGVDIKFTSGTKNVSYFNIIDTTLAKDAKKQIHKKGKRNVTTTTEITSTPVNTGISVEPTYALKSPTATNYSQQAVDFIKNREGFKTTAYPDGGSYAIGYGNHQYEDGSTVKAGDPAIDQKRGESILKAHMNIDNKAIRRDFKNIAFAQNELDALQSYYYNTGGGHALIPLIKSYKLSPVLYGAGLKSAWLKSRVTEQGKGKDEVPELVSRRLKESLLFFNANYFNTGTTESQTTTVEEEYDIPGQFDTILDQTKMFNNFKVDDDIFNFFLRRQQLDTKYI